MSHLSIQGRWARAGLGVLALLLVSGWPSGVAAQPAAQPPAQPAARPPAEAGWVGGVPWVRQWYSLTCEYAAAAAVTWYYGNLVSQRVFIDEMPYSYDPHVGFRGRINGPVGGTTDYGVYAEPLVPVLQRHGFNAQALYTDVGWLKAQIVADRPVVVWMTYQAWWSNPTYIWADDCTRFSLVPWEHCVVVTAYDDWGVTIMDPYTGTFDRYNWGDFTRAWGYFDNMALLITPAGQ
jgi:uncharacterized protein YvpB